MLAKSLVAVLAATFLAGSAGMAHAQGTITQDPGRMTPGNLTFQHLGPAASAPATDETIRGNLSNPEPGTVDTGAWARLPQSGSSSAGPGAAPRSGLGGNTAGGR